MRHTQTHCTTNSSRNSDSACFLQDLPGPDYFRQVKCAIGTAGARLQRPALVDSACHESRRHSRRKTSEAIGKGSKTDPNMGIDQHPGLCQCMNAPHGARPMLPLCAICLKIC